MLSGIWLKITAALGFIIGVLLLNTKRQSNKIDKLKHENETIHKKSEIMESQSTFVAKVLADEQDELLKMAKEVNSDDKKPSIDDINNI